MSNLTPEQRYYRNKNILLSIIVAAGIIIIFLVWKGCQNSRSTNEAYDAIEARLNNAIEDSVQIRAALSEERKKNNELEMAVSERTSDYIITHNELLRESAKAKQLAADYKKARERRDTVTSFELCDSMAAAIEYRDKQIQSISSKALILDSLRKEQIKGLKKINNILQVGYDSLLTAAVFVKKELPKIKPNSKMYIDAAATTGYVNGLGGGLSLMDTKGNRFGAKYMFTNQKPIYMIEYGRLLNFKRK